MAPRLALAWLAVSVGCDDADAECRVYPAKSSPRANLVLSAAAIDFGSLARGSSAEATLHVEHPGVDPGTGEAVTHDIGVGRRGAAHEPPFAIAGSSTGGFAASWSLDEAVCPAGASVSTQWVRNDRGADTGWSPPDDDSPEPVGGEIVRIGPGCRLPLHLSFAGGAGGVHAAGLVVETVSAPGIDGRAPALEAKTERVQQVLLTAEVLGTTTQAEPIIAGVVDASPDECEEGEPVALSTWAYDPGGGEITYHWGDNWEASARFDDPLSATPVWTCPEVEAGLARNVTIYVMVTGPGGNQLWGYTVVTAWGERLARCDELEELSALPGE